MRQVFCYEPFFLVLVFFAALAALRAGAFLPFASVFAAGFAVARDPAVARGFVASFDVAEAAFRDGFAGSAALRARGFAVTKLAPIVGVSPVEAFRERAARFGASKAAAAGNAATGVVAN